MHPSLRCRACRAGALVVLAVPLPLHAQRTAALPEVVVTAARGPQTVEELVADVTVIDAEAIARSGAQSLSEILQRQPGVEVLRNGGPASVSAAFIRGANRGQTIVLVDGLRVASSSVGAPTLEAIPVSQIERIEILRGPASSLYGADAIGGIVQVFTRRPAGAFGAHVDAGYGTFDTRTASAGIAGSLGAVRVSLNAGRRRSDGFNATTPDAAFIYDPDRDGYASDDIALHSVLALAPGHELHAQVLRNRLDAQFDGGAGFDDRTVTRLTAWQAGSRDRWTAQWSTALTVGETTDDSLSTSAFGAAAFRTRQRQYGWQNDFTLPHGKLALAFERREERLDENVGFAVRERDTNAVVAVWQFQTSAHALQSNLRHDHSDQYGGRTTGSIAWGWRFAPGWRATAGAGTAFKAPSFNDLYYPDFSNPALRPETSRNVEAGLYWDRRVGAVDVHAQANAWHNRVRRLIVFQCDASFACAPQNVANATLQGVTLSGELRWRDTSIRTSLDVQDPKDDDTGRLLPRRAKRHGSVALTQAIGPARLGVEVVASSRRYDDAEHLRPLGGYAIVNVTAEVALGNGWSVLVRGDNVADRDYVLASGYATGGAQGFLAIRWQP